ncbi:NucA/NucB deoxyribonuclease domain-containing protein [Wenjunlia tyrosinilytica]|uniref:Deoxyribonuclease NucA/NucB domain-containing protein n=1 Tax=Wenjunlia tyrosinilytica TaxID=1544741 RepID=A0A918E0R4_9ACTN|nr:hypothetical protein [Wenjunlia tyrosinilytica]GGO99380.1 hypothetical protein GCM10012280_65700 [Wenjunlia tyrosinilytica]
MATPRQRLSITSGAIMAALALLLSPTAGPAWAEDLPPVTESPTQATATPDPNAADIDFTDQEPEEMPAAPEDSNERNARECMAEAIRTKSTRLCVDASPDTPEDLEEAQQAVADAASDSFLPWCDKDKHKRKDVFTRFGACMNKKMAKYTLYDRNGDVLGIARFAMSRRIALASKGDGRDLFHEELNLVPTRLDAAMVELTLTWKPDCAVKCKSSKQSWSGSRTWFPGDKHKARGQLSHWWTESSGNDTLNLTGILEADSPVNQGEPGTVAWYNLMADVRCDDEVGRSPGCVFFRSTPAFKVNSKKFPAAQTFYQWVQTEFPDHWGSKAEDSPLHRLASKAEQDKNRRKICDSTFKPHPDTHETSCDEFPFAASQESGGQLGIKSGKECVQMYYDTDANYLALDSRFPRPSQKERCGRGNIPQGQNEGVGGDLGRFTVDVRLLDQDAYYIDVGRIGG